MEDCKFVISEVHFKEGPMLTILHYSWLVSTDNVTQYCLWPNKKGSSIKLAKSECYPEDSWIQYRCRIIYKCESFTQAQKKLNRFANDNNYKGETTNDEDKGRGKRQKFKNLKLFTDESSSQESHSFIKSLPKPPSWAKRLNDNEDDMFGPAYHSTEKRNKTNQIDDSEDDMFEPAYHSTEKRNKTNHIDDSEDDMFEPAYHSTEKRNKTNHIGCTDNSDKDIVELNISAREISQDERSQDETTSNDTINLSTIANLLQKQFKATLYTNCLLEQLLQSNNQSVQPASSSIQEKFRSRFHNLPLNSLEDVVEMENKLKDPASQHLMKNRLRQCGCRNSIQETVTTILRTVMSDTCAQYYNFDGKNNAKNPFKELTLNSIIIDVVLNFHTDATEHDVKTKIRNWLRLASTRISNKIIRQTLKQKNNT